MTFVIALLLAQAHPCMQDAQKLCPGVEPGQGRIAACLKQHKDEVSAECKAKIATFREERRQKAAGAVEACRDDAQKLCPDVKPGKGRMIKCLKKHQSELSPGCSAALAK